MINMTEGEWDAIMKVHLKGAFSPAKAALAALGIILNAEVERMGIRVNVLAPAARTRMTIPLGGPVAKETDDSKFDEFHPRNMSPLVVFYGSDACDVGGMVAGV